MSGITLICLVLACPFVGQSSCGLPTLEVQHYDLVALQADTATSFKDGHPKAASSGEPKKIEKKAFSELALFLFGSGFALFIALLGWSDQIRSFNRDSLDLVNRFIDKTRIQRSDFRRFLKPSSPQERVAALTAIMQSGRLKTVEHIQLSGLFNQLGRTSTNLERLCSRKYDLTLYLTACLFGVGTISLFTTPADQITLGLFTIRVELLIVLLPLILILVLLGMILRCNHWEKLFNDQLTAISERT